MPKLTLSLVNTDKAAPLDICWETIDFASDSKAEASDFPSAKNLGFGHLPISSTSLVSFLVKCFMASVNIISELIPSTITVSFWFSIIGAIIDFGMAEAFLVFVIDFFLFSSVLVLVDL
ncbi:hypothetical protein AYI69_g9905 [Smittium culicis]|uniref:Uncharacterized protein n=1 Tax=Smittium culicis TaxID=133412 RepID=A0A1R1X9G0_9FUNG|nr:hypothetical protein AYI69_g9905 [Smittium culicis]